ncbi:sulfotransferase family protein [Streptomyces sp. NPDC029526]|uniref:sulfotransferase-like domain-containing protein n=1 Tax=Streptomyces sp. NPDC029526 TaxID=3155728 RepID=UPI0033D63EE8
MNGRDGDGRLVVLWSAPRCRSTVFSRSIAERGDFLVLHEPFSHLADFGREEIEGVVCRTEAEVIARLLALGRERRVFVKDTTDFRFPGVLADTRFLTEARHTFIVRDPREAIASHYGLNPGLGRDEIGFAWLREIHDRVVAVTGTEPAVVDAADLVAAPADTLRAYCAAIGVPFLEHALAWRPGGLPSWRKTARWHRDASASGTISPAVTSRPALDVPRHPVLGPFYLHHLPHYEHLWQRRLRVT